MASTLLWSRLAIRFYRTYEGLKHFSISQNEVQNIQVFIVPMRD